MQAVTKRIPVSEIRPSDYNPRVDLKPGDPEYERIKNSILNWGLVETLVVNKKTKKLIGGHQRLKIIKDLGFKHVIVSLVDIDDPAEERLLNIALNKISGLWNEEALAKVLNELSLAAKKIDLSGFNTREISTILGNFQIGSSRKLDAPAGKPKRGIVKKGELWGLGKHRFLCGDATNVSDVKRLLGKDKPNLMVTDPPYGVSYDAEWRDRKGLGVGANSLGKVKNDDRIDWSAAYELFPGNIAYVWHAAYFGRIVTEGLERLNFKIISQIIWIKQNFAISRGDYHWRHEPCLYLVRKGKNHNWQDRRDQTTTWEIQNDNAFGGTKGERFGHSTQKPVECMLRPILNNSRAGQLVYDPFLGSGSTIIAAEKSGRACLGLEIDPAYCDQIIERYQKLFDKPARKIK